MNEAETAMLDAQASYQRDQAFRRYVDAAVAEAMRHVEHIDSDVERRDFHHVAVVAAMATLRFAMDGDHLLKTMEAQRDAAQEGYLKMAKLTPLRMVMDPAGLT